MKQQNSKNHEGHRQRLRKRLLDCAESLQDYELLEYLLFYVFRRRDTKQISKDLIKHFEGIKHVIFADDVDILKINGLGESTVVILKLIKEIYSRILLDQVAKSVVIKTGRQVQDYYKKILGSTKKEQLRAMFLNNRNKLLDEKLFHVGTINQTAFYPREIVQYALNCGASAVILVHNHPGGDPKPSQSDILISRKLDDLLKKLDITLLDHLIIGDRSVTSFKEDGII